MELHNPKCAAQHIDTWMVEPEWFANALSTIKAGLWPIRAAAPIIPDTSETIDEYFEVTRDGIAIVSLKGPLMKPWSKYGGTSTVFARKMIRDSVSAGNVSGIMLHIDSPGGTVSGTHDLALEIQRAAKAKPVFAHIDDLGASAAYWVASQAQKVTANATALVGSIGTYSVVHDMSGQADMLGIKVHVISTGAFKGAGIPGTEITEDQLAEMQARVDDLNEFFLRGVSNGRDMDREELNKIADGRVFIASKARSFGLVDKVTHFSKAYDDFAAFIKRADRQRKVSADVRGSRV